MKTYSFLEPNMLFMGFSHAFCELHEISWQTDGPSRHKINYSVLHSFPYKRAKQLKCVAFLWAKYAANNHFLLPCFDFDFKAFRTVLFCNRGIIYGLTSNTLLKYVMC